MLKYFEKDVTVVFQEIPDMISLAIPVTNCQHRCPNCHSAYLQGDIGCPLTEESLDSLIEKNLGVNCVVFMGEGNDKEGIASLARHVRESYPGVSTAVYSGDTEVPECYYDAFDYIKIGPYIEELGGLDKRTTNQRLYHVQPDWVEDITYKFW